VKQIYICEDTITGLYSALHDAWKECRNAEAGIELKGRIQQQLFCEYKIVEESEEKAVKLERMIKRYLGYNAYWEIYHALLSADAGKGTAVFEVMQEARNIRYSEKVMEHLSNSSVADVFSMSRSVSNEAHRYEEFIRFRELKNGILFSEITPKSQILTCIADRFEDRFPLENWMIYDKTHKVSLVHEMNKRWRLVWRGLSDEGVVKNVSEEEYGYEMLWKRFFHSVSIKERENPKCQQTHLPFRYREKMTEFSCAGEKIGL
jgi:probable DNA metabolism protein